MRIYELTTQYDARQSFYGKAHVIEEDNGDLTLQSYSTKVAKIINSPRTASEDDFGRFTPIAEVYGTYSSTTLRHIKEFLKQNGFVAENSKQIMKDYGKQ